METKDAENSALAALLSLLPVLVSRSTHKLNQNLVFQQPASTNLRKFRH